MSEFDTDLEVGEKVAFQGKEGTVVAISYDDDRITVDAPEKNGGQNLHYGHISQFKPRRVVPELPLEDEEPSGKHGKAKASE